MIVYVCNRKQAESDEITKMCTAVDAISISTPGHPGAMLGGGFGAWENVLHLQFHDIIPEDCRDLTDSKGNKLIAFDMLMARRVVEWIDSIPVEDPILAHCDAGVSRSMAVGRYIRNLTDRVLEILTPNMSTDIFYNVHVYNQLYRYWYSREEGI